MKRVFTYYYELFFFILLILIDIADILYRVEERDGCYWKHLKDLKGAL